MYRECNSVKFAFILFQCFMLCCSVKTDYFLSFFPFLFDLICSFVSPINENGKCSCPTIKEETRQNTFSLAQDKVVPFPRNKKLPIVVSSGNLSNRSTPMPPPRRTNSHQRFVIILLLFRFVCFFKCFNRCSFDFFWHHDTRNLQSSQPFVLHEP